MNWRIVKHKDLSLTDGLKIACLKEQHWHYGLESQLFWMIDNIGANDIHLLGEDVAGSSAVLKAYATLSNLKIQIDLHHLDALGVGCVCVDKTMLKKGLGKQLLIEANRLISAEKKNGFLLCKQTLLEFYEKCGWQQLKYSVATVADERYDQCIMILNGNTKCMEININKNF